MQPFEPRDHREEGPEAGIFSGAEGKFIIYEDSKDVDEPVVEK